MKIATKKQSLIFFGSLILADLIPIIGVILFDWSINSILIILIIELVFTILFFVISSLSVLKIATQNQKISIIFLSCFFFFIFVIFLIIFTIMIVEENIDFFDKFISSIIYLQIVIPIIIFVVSNIFNLYKHTKNDLPKTNHEKQIYFNSWCFQLYFFIGQIIAGIGAVFAFAMTESNSFKFFIAVISGIIIYKIILFVISLNNKLFRNQTSS